MAIYGELLKYGLRVANWDMMSLGMEKHNHPWSITEDEFNFIKNYISIRRYTSGYELATGFGVSSCAIGSGLRESGGKLISVDAYIEEHVNLAWGYRDKKREVHPEGDGFQVASQLCKHFGLEDTIEYRVGWSPDDIPSILGDKKLDFAFIDGQHFDENVLADVEAIKDRMEPPFTVMLHDTHAFTKKTLDTIAGWFKTELVLPKIPKTFCLGYFARSE